jgi:arylformamidase
MTYYDVTLPIRDKMLSWPSDPDVRLKAAKTIARGGSRVTLLSMGTHTGTHFDAPSHVLKRGKGLDAFSPETLIGPAEVVDLTGIDGPDIEVAHLEKHVPEGAERVLFKTANTTKKLMTKAFTEDYVALSGDAAAWLAAAGVKLVGVDYLSVNRRGGDGRGHTELLKHDIPIIEGLWLVDVPPGQYELIALPIRIEKGDGAPARVLLRR